MKLTSSRSVAAALWVAAGLVVFAVLSAGVTAALQGPPAGRGAGRGGGRGAGDSNPGPWDLETESGPIRVTQVTDGLDHPWGLAFLPDGDLLVTERPGRLRVIRDGQLDPTPITPLPAMRTVRLSGLLDVALHPDFEDNRVIYFSYSKVDAESEVGAAETLATTGVARARWDGGSTLEDVEDIFVADNWYSLAQSEENGRCCGQGPADGSFGSRLAFDRDGYLYITLGDRNWGEMAQKPDSHMGKIVRLLDDGRVPEDNPFVGMDGYRPEIFTLGHRNPLGLFIHPQTGEIWSTEFGPMGGDELNRIEAGKNYGWILVTEGTHYDQSPAELANNSVEGMQDPVMFWGPPSINPGNLIFYTGDLFPEWNGHLLMATMSRSVLNATFEDGVPVHEERMLTEIGRRFRDIRQGPDGLIYLLTDETAGAVLRIEPGA